MQRFATRITISIMVAAGLALGGRTASAQVTCLEHLGQPVTMDEVEQGSLLYRTAEPGRYIAAPTQATDVVITVRGVVARARVSQRFSNPSEEWVEGVYVFPLPEDAAVDSMRMRIGERVIEGQIKEREQARKVYERAREEGRKASLVEQERPNIFTTSVANIGPDEQIEVEIEYQQTLRYDHGAFQLRFPMVVGPRFVPGVAVATAPEGMGWARNTDQVADAERVTPPVVPPGSDPLNPVSLEVSLDLGLSLARLVSPYHAVQIWRSERTCYHVSLDRASVAADRDFVLEWAPEVGQEPQAAVFTEELDGQYYVLLMMMPPRAEHMSEARLPRETMFVIDTSGSMHGASIEQARQALLYGLDKLHPDDHFNVIQFNTSTSSLFSSSQQAFPAALGDARRYVEGLGAGGGTQMAPALTTALDDGVRQTSVRQVVFITDGCVGNEDELFALIARRLGRSRLFTVGIGSAPNSHFMERAASFGRGTFTHIGSPSEVQAKMEGLFNKLENPVLSDIQVVWPDLLTEAWPERIPDLYSGEPVVIAARLGTLSGEAVVTGWRGVESWEMRMPLAAGSARAGVHQLWARRKIASLTDSISIGADRDEVRAKVVEVALQHHLVSRFTSLVAVDVTPSRPDGEHLAKRAVPTNLPHGWSHEAVFGNLPQGGTGAMLSCVVGMLLLLVAVTLRLLATAGRLP